MSDKMQELYNNYFEFTSNQLEDHKPMQIAAIMMAQALSIYKTILNEVDYERLVDTISDSRDNVQKFESTILQ